jgi:serine/threonine protein kinase
MTLARHYVRIPKHLQQYAMNGGAPESDWRTGLFLDVTHGGSVLTFEPLPAGTGPVGIGLIGDKLYYEATIDKDREDTLYIYRVQGVSRKPRVPPGKYEASFDLISPKATVRRDPIQGLFSLATGERVEQQLVEAEGLQANPSDELLEILSRCAEDFRMVWGPDHVVSEPPSPQEFIRSFRRPWIRFRLEQYARLTPRQASLVNETLRPKTMGQAERSAMLTALSFEMLNSFVYDNSGKPDSVYDLLQEFSLLPLAPAFRVKVWAGTLAGLGKADFLRRLKQTAAALTSIWQRSPAEGALWQRGLLPLIQSLAEREKDTSLAKVYEDSLAVASPLLYVLDWVGKLEFRGPAPQSAEAPPGPSVEEIALRPPDSDPTHASAELPVAMVEPSAEQVNPVIDRWVLGRQVPDLEVLDATVRDVYARLSKLATVLPGGTGAHKVAQLATTLGSLSREIHEWLKLLPDPAVVETDYAESFRAYQEGRKLLGTDIDAVLSDGKISARDLREAIEMAQASDQLEILPRWAWALEDDPLSQLPDDGKLARAWVRRLVVPQVRERVRSILEAIQVLEKDDAALLPAVPPPDDDGSEIGPLEVRRHVIEWVHEYRELVSPLPVEVREMLMAGEKSSRNNEHVIYCASIYRDTRDRLAPETAREMVKDLAAIQEQAQCEARGEAYLFALDQLEKFAGKESLLTVDIGFVKASAGRLKRPEPETLTPPLSAEHNLVGVPAKRAPLDYFPDESQLYGWISVPLLLRARHKKSWKLSIKVDVRSGHRRDWPAAWPAVTPEELEVKESDWRLDGSDIYYHSFKLRIPIRRQGRGEGFKFDLEIVDQQTAREAAQRRQFEWEVINEAPQSLVPRWLGSTDPRYVDTNPIGPQRRSKEILARLRKSNSFAVIAPRRFGKTTLVEYLRKRDKEENMVIPDAVVCTNYFRSGSKLDYDQLWNVLSNRLQNETGSTINQPIHDGLPEETAFDNVRSAAKLRGKTGIVILIDEAQLFFPKKNGATFGDLLKDRLERHWSRTDRDDLAPLTMGLVGLPSLKSRAGTNLLGYLRPFDQDRLEDEELGGLIRYVTDGRLHTTREARQRLAKSTNLYILRTLLDELALDVFRDQRTWANYDDVIEVEKELERKLAGAEAEYLADYVRDGFNDAESVNDFEPNASLALAVALASARERKGSSTTLYSDTQREVRSWCEELRNTAPILRLTYDDGQLQEHLHTLQERRIFKDAEFSSGLLEAWLLGLRLQRKSNSEFWQKLLMKAAVRRVRCPEVLEPAPEAAGGQAQISTYSSDGVKYAVRKATLHTQEDRTRFVEEKSVLETLLETLHKRTAVADKGQAYVFKLHAVGLSADDEWEAIQIYQWVEGVDLSKKKAELPSPFVANLGLKLARALQFLHHCGILHRDLRPQNIILSDRNSDPVIIDFGFARRLAVGGRTRLNEDWAAPEVRRENPVWSPAADIYSLAKTLESILTPGNDHSVLRAVLDQAGHSDRDRRPSADDLESLFHRATVELEVETKKADIWRQISTLGKIDRERSSQFGDILDDSRPKFEALALGYGRTQFERCRQVAIFLNHVGESFEYFALSKDRSRTRKGSKGEAAPVSKEISFLHTLRTLEAHFLPNKNAELSRFDYPDEAKMREMTLYGAEQMDSALGLSSLRAIVEAVL